MPETLSVPPLRSGGIMLGYQCGLACGHCLYRSGPDADVWMDEATLDSVLDALSRERRLIDIHLSGGEATLKPDLLALAVRKALAKGLRLSYLETNGQFAASVDRAREVFLPLKKAGLNAVLISVSPYHNETIPLRHTMNCLEAAVDVFGHDSVFPWLAHCIPMLARMDPETPHTVDEFLAANDIPPDDGTLFRLFPLTPGGRVPERLRKFFPKRPAAAFQGHCLDMLTATDHFHFDPCGNLFTGHCPGIVSGRVPTLHEAKGFDTDPVFVQLATGGPVALMETARERYGFAPDDDGYVSPCDLCFQVRRAMRDAEAEAWPELNPAIFYR